MGSFFRNQHEDFKPARGFKSTNKGKQKGIEHPKSHEIMDVSKSEWPWQTKLIEMELQSLNSKQNKKQSMTIPTETMELALDL